jgi:type IV pilus assembly protein PilP
MIHLHNKYFGVKKIRIIFICMLTLGLTACSNDMSDLHGFVEKAKSTPKSTVEPLPAIKPHETYKYQAGNLRNPFAEILPSRPSTVAKTKKKGKGPRPIPGRPREILEEFPLDSLRMVGTLEQQTGLWALIKASDGTIHKVKTGNYLGQNHGKIIRITESKLELMEIVPDGLGDYTERPASVALSETQQ